MNKAEIQEEMQNRYLDMISKNGGKIPEPHTDKELIQNLEDAMDQLSIAYHEKSNTESINLMLETRYLEASTALKNLKSIL